MEINTIKENMNLQRAEIGVGEVSNLRTAQFTALDMKKIEKITKRIADMTDFNPKGFEMISLLNYGIGGHHGWHYDYTYPTNDSFTLKFGDRVATALIYLSDVEESGGTAFPYLELLVSPEKGAVLFFYNLKNDDTADSRTLHGACPVIKGSKWVATLWIWLYDQFQNRPCKKIE